MKKILRNSLCFLMLTMVVMPAHARVEEYEIDTKGAHAFIQFRIMHLGYSWLHGRFNEFEGTFNIDRKDLTKSNVEVKIDPASIDSNHATRDKHLRGEKFLNVEEFPKAGFKSTSIKMIGDKQAIIKGDLTLHGVTKPVELKTELVGEGKDPWGGYRVGFESKVVLPLKDFGIDYDLGPASAKVEISLSIEGKRL